MYLTIKRTPVCGLFIGNIKLASSAISPVRNRNWNDIVMKSQRNRKEIASSVGYRVAPGLNFELKPRPGRDSGL